MTLHQPHSTEMSMRSKLFLYMALLAVLLLFVLVSGIMMLGRFDGAEKSTSKALEMQMEVFEKDMSSYFESMAASSIDLSRYVSDFIDDDAEIAGASFDNLSDNPQKIGQVQAALMSTLVQRLQNQNCSGIFVMFDATVNSRVENAALSRTGLYLQHNRYQDDENVILFRGNSSIGKTQDIMPHRKWRLEFRTDQFPSYDEAVATAQLPLNESYLLTDCTTLAGTSDNVVLMTVPIVGRDGTFYGLCGYEVSADYFTIYHAQPAAEEHLACMILSAKGNKTYASTGLSCSGQNNYVEPLEGEITITNATGDLSAISDGAKSFIGLSEEVELTPNNEGVSLAVMIPKDDYARASLESVAQIVILIILLLFFAVSCSIYFNRKYLQPILKELEHTKQHAKDLEQVQAELEQARLELSRLSYSRKTEVDPDNYQAFLNGLKTLTATENMILDYYLEGKSVKQIMGIAGIKESTLRFHNRNIYAKLGVNSLKQLLLYASVMRQTGDGDQHSK